MQFQIETFQNPYLPVGTTRVDAVLTVTATRNAAGPLETGGALVVGIIVDSSGSMQGARIEAVRQATRRAVALLRPDMYFFIARFSSDARMVFPLSPATDENKARADAAIRAIPAGGDTWMSSGLEMARGEFLKMPGAIYQALFLTDGKNNEQDEPRLNVTLNSCEGVFQCECRGVGTDWQVKQLQRIATKLLGSARIIAEPAGLEADFSETIQTAAGRALGDVRLRLWTPKTVRITSVKQMSPEIVVLTDRGTAVSAQATDYPTGAWGVESRDYYIAAEVNATGEVGDEILAANPSIVFQAGGQAQEVKYPAARILATWTSDEALSARISREVAHYTGQEELAGAIQDGLEARASGDVETATRLLGRAAKLAQESGNDETTSRLRKVVDIVDAGQGTVRLKQRVEKADEMDLDLGSTRTSRAQRPAPTP